KVVAQQHVAGELKQPDVGARRAGVGVLGAVVVGEAHRPVDPEAVVEVPGAVEQHALVTGARVVVGRLVTARGELHAYIRGGRSKCPQTGEQRGETHGSQ